MWCGCRRRTCDWSPGVCGTWRKRLCTSGAASSSSRSGEIVSTNELIPAPEAEAPARPVPPPQGRPASPEVLDADFSEAPSRHLRDYLRVVYKYRWLACTCFGLTLGLTVFITLLTPR